MQHICSPCAAHILCLQTMCSICVGICGLCTQHIFKHGAKHICRPCTEPICNLCASHSCFIRFWRKTYWPALRRAYLQALGGILVYWQACAPCHLVKHNTMSGPRKTNSVLPATALPGCSAQTAEKLPL